MDDASKTRAPSAGARSTPLIADACLRLGRGCRFARGIVPLFPGQPAAGRALPVRHLGSVDVFLEALDRAQAGDVLVVDNAGRADEGCIGDLIALECKSVGLSGIVVWGAVRDTAELAGIGLPIYCTGRCPLGPPGVRADTAGAQVSVAGTRVTAEDYVVADDDGVLFLAARDLGDVLRAADRIHRREREQAELLRGGRSLRAELRFAEFQAERRRNPAYTLREHLERHGGAIEV